MRRRDLVIAAASIAAQRSAARDDRSVEVDVTRRKHVRPILVPGDLHVPTAQQEQYCTETQTGALHMPSFDSERQTILDFLDSFLDISTS